MTKRILILVTILAFLIPVAAFSQDEPDDHEAEAIVQNTEAAEHAEGEEHDEIVVKLSSEAQKMAGLTLEHVVMGRIVQTSDLSGEVGFNEESLVHISPRFAGIALEARCRLGSFVNAGEIVAVIESNESMNSYSIKAPISGWIIERHISPGEYVSGESSIYVLADLSTVWVNLAVYPKDAGLIKAGGQVLITAIGSEQQVSGTIDFVTPMLNVHTRSSTARVILPNPDNVWRPGTFVHAKVVTEQGEQGLVVEKEAVQFIGEESVVFIVEGDDEFAAVDVVVGDSDHRYIRILRGLTEGIKYVAAGAFELKAQIVTGSLSGHAGHGH